MVQYIEVPESSEIPLDQIPENAIGGIWDCKNNQWQGTWYYDKSEMYDDADGIARSGYPWCVLDIQGEIVEESGF